MDRLILIYLSEEYHYHRLKILSEITKNFTIKKNYTTSELYHFTLCFKNGKTENIRNSSYLYGISEYILGTLGKNNLNKFYRSYNSKYITKSK